MSREKRWRGEERKKRRVGKKKETETDKSVKDKKRMKVEKG